MHELVDALGNRQILEPHATEIAQRTGGRQLLADTIDDRLRQQYLTAVRRTHDPCRAIDGTAEVVVVAPFDFAEM